MGSEHIERPISTEAAPRKEAASSATLFWRTLRYTLPYKRTLGAAVAFSFLFTLGRNGRAYLLKPLVDDAILVSDLERFLELSLLGVAIVVIMPIGVFGRTYLTKYALGQILLDIRSELAAKLLRLPITYHDFANTGDTLTRTMLDATQAQRVCRLAYYELLQSAISIIGGFATMLFLSWQLTLLSAVTMPIMAIVLAYFASRVRKRATRRQEQLSDVTQRLSTILTGVKVIKAFRGEGLENKSFFLSAQKFFKRQMKVVLQGVLSRSLIEFLNSGTAIAIVFIGGYMVMNNIWDLTVGALTAFVLAAAMTYAPVKTVSQNWPELMDALASAERFFEILDEPEDPPDRAGAVRLESLQKTVAFKNVSFGYNAKRVLHNVSFEAHRGEVIAIVGRTGSGKTTMADLLLRFYEPSDGAITIDGVDLRDMQRESFLDQIAIVTQDPFLFDTTIRENIRYGRPDADHAAFDDACRTAQLGEFVDPLPDGYDTEVGEFGVMLSGGQRQRITIARAILKDPSILVFDEATSALDAKTERSVQDALEALRGRRTVFIIAHRLSTIRRADRILVLNAGRIVQTGTHDELMATPGLYREFVSLQGEDERASA